MKIYVLSLLKLEKFKSEWTTWDINDLIQIIHFSGSINPHAEFTVLCKKWGMLMSYSGIVIGWVVSSKTFIWILEPECEYSCR